MTGNQEEKSMFVGRVRDVRALVLHTHHQSNIITRTTQHSNTLVSLVKKFEWANDELGTEDSREKEKYPCVHLKFKITGLTFHLWGDHTNHIILTI